MKTAALFLVWIVVLVTSEANGRIPDFWVRVSSENADLIGRELVSLDLRFRNGVTIGIEDLPRGWAAAVQKDKEGIFSVQLAGAGSSSSPARLAALLACVTICPDEIEERDLKVEFVGGEAVTSAGAGDTSASEYLKLDPAALALKQEVKVIPATKKPNQPQQRNAGSRPSSDDSPASETPSSFGPRG